MRILVVDDDDVTRELIAGILGDRGYDVRAVEGGREAIEALAAEPIPVVICDWEMPGVDGLAVCRWVRSDPARRSTYVIMLTAREGLANSVEGLFSGADTFLSKPCDAATLIEHVRVGQRLSAPAASARPSFTSES